jgi:LacI family transcriptional regulator
LRLQGYEQALEAGGVAIDGHLVREGRFDTQSGYEQTKSLLSLQQPPSAIFVSNALMTTGAFHALQDMNKRCPEDVALVSFDDLEWFAIFRPRVSAVAQPAYALGSTAADVLLRRITGKLIGPPRRKLLPCELVVRDSSCVSRAGQ